MARLNRSWKVEGEGAALAAELHRVLEVSHRQAKGLIDAGCVKVAGKEAQSYGLRLEPGTEVCVAYDPERAYKELPRPRTGSDAPPFQVLLEDRHLLFVDKPAGLLTVPAEKSREACLADAIADHYRRRGFKRYPLYIVHRLDRWTSGVLVFAKTPEALHGLKKLFEEHKLQRTYRAILVGELPENSGTLLGRVVERHAGGPMKVVRHDRDDKGAKSAITHYRVLERLPGHTVVEVKLETGRRNQIRVQFADRGYPLLGDSVYGQASPLIDRQALHAERLAFKHPAGDDVMIGADSKLPADFEAALKALRTQRRLVRAESGQQGEEGIYKPKERRDRKFVRVERAKYYAEKEAEREGRAPARRPEREDRRGDRPERRGERPERAPRPDRESRPRRSEGPEREGRPQVRRPERPERRAERSEPLERRPERKAERPDHSPRPERDHRPRRAEASERPNRDGARPRTDGRPRTEDRPRAGARPSTRPGARPSGGRPAAGKPAASGTSRPKRAGAAPKPRTKR